MNARAHAHTDPDEPEAPAAREPVEAQFEIVPCDAGDETLSDEIIDALASELLLCKRTMTLQLALTWGERIFNVIYEGDLDRLRSRDEKDVSLRRLAERMDVHATVLHQAVHLYDFIRRHPALLDEAHLTKTHFCKVLPLPDDKRVHLLRQAAVHRWSTHELDRHARKEKKQITRGRGGRPRLAQGIKTLNFMSKYARRPEVYFDGLEDVTRLSLAKARRMQHTIDVVMEQLEQARERLEDHLNQLGDVAGAPGQPDAQP